MTTATESSTLQPAGFGGGRHALVITLDRVERAFYTGWRGELPAVKNDREAMMNLLYAANFSITELTNEKATRDAVTEAIAEQARARTVGDHVVVYFSGHGATLPDLNADELGLLPDGAWCLHDGMFVDDELTEALTQFNKGVGVVLISDSCFFGTIVAGGSAEAQVERRALATDSRGSKLAPVDIGQRVYEVQRSFYQPILERRRATPNAAKARLLVLAACRRNELARVDGDRSVFTGAIVDVWSSSPRQLTYKELFRDVSNKVTGAMNGKQNPQKRSFGMTPLVLDDQPAFGGPPPRPRLDDRPPVEGPVDAPPARPMIENEAPRHGELY